MDLLKIEIELRNKRLHLTVEIDRYGTERMLPDVFLFPGRGLTHIEREYGSVPGAPPFDTADEQRTVQAFNQCVDGPGAGRVTCFKIMTVEQQCAVAQACLAAPEPDESIEFTRSQWNRLGPDRAHMQAHHGASRDSDSTFIRHFITTK